MSLGGRAGQLGAQDVGLGGMASTRKHYVGRALAGRPDLVRPDRPRLVGLVPVESGARFRAGSVLMPEGERIGTLCVINDKPGRLEPHTRLILANIARGIVNVLLLRETYDAMVKGITDYIRAHGSITVAQVRDQFGTSRKYALALMERLDELKITRRVGDERVLR